MFINIRIIICIFWFFKLSFYTLNNLNENNTIVSRINKRVFFYFLEFTKTNNITNDLEWRIYDSDTHFKLKIEYNDNLNFVKIYYIKSSTETLLYNNNTSDKNFKFMFIFSVNYEFKFLKISCLQDSNPKINLFYLNLYDWVKNINTNLKFEKIGFPNTTHSLSVKYINYAYFTNPSYFYNININSKTFICNSNQYSDNKGNCFDCPANCNRCYGNKGEYCSYCNGESESLNKLSNQCCSLTCNGCDIYKNYCKNCATGYKKFLTDPYLERVNNYTCIPSDNEYFFDEITQLKVKCLNKCTQCYINKDYCLKCNNNNGFIEDKIIYDENSIQLYSCKCKPGLYYDINNDICNYCHESCKTCNGPNTNDCLSCEEDFKNNISINGKCICEFDFIKNYIIDKSKEIGKISFCKKCSPICKTCDFSSSNSKCWTCNLDITIQNNYSGSSYKCLCLPGYYFYKITRSLTLKELCIKCFDFGCKSCSSTKINNCSKCFDTFIEYRDSLNYRRCKCPIGKKITADRVIVKSTNQIFYKNINCSLNCHSSCESCFGNLDNNCISCNLQIFIIDEKSNKCLCKDGFYNDNTETNELNICKPCHYTCKTCNGPLSNNCLTCEGSFIDNITSTNQCLCNNPNKIYYDDDLVGLLIPIKNKCFNCNSNKNYDFDNNICMDCHKSCFTCNGKEKNNCLSCNNGFTFNSNGTCTCNNQKIIINKLCKCPDGFYIKDNNCVKCFNLCKTCRGPKKNDCLDCYNPLILMNNICVNFSTIIDIYDKYNNLPTVYNVDCYKSCKSCNGKSYIDCLTCDSIIFNNNTTTERKCKCILDYNYFNYLEKTDNKNEFCKNCSLKNLECYGPLIYQYLNCNYWIHNGSISICINEFGSKNTIVYNYYELYNRYNKKKKNNPCSRYCLVCKGELESECIKCHTDKLNIFLINGTCSCPNGYFVTKNTINVNENEYNYCKKCNNSCKTCNESKCLTCHENMTLKSNSCNCNEGFYELSGVLKETYINNKIITSYVLKCFKCHKSCLTCSGKEINNCSSCDSNYYLSLNNNTCNCKDISSDLVNILDSNFINNNCLDCSSSCKVCSFYFNNYCNYSKEYLKLDYNSCDCKKNFYINKISSNEPDLCDKCHDICKNGNQQSVNCIKIISSNNTCKDGFYYFNDTKGKEIKDYCLNCHYSCKTCNGPNKNNCLSCYADFKNNIDPNGTCNCEDGYYIDFIKLYYSNPSSQTSVCKKCDKFCKSCILDGEDYCITCKDGLIKSKNRKFEFNSIVYDIFSCKNAPENKILNYDTRSSIIFLDSPMNCKYSLSNYCYDHCNIVNKEKNIIQYYWVTISNFYHKKCKCKPGFYLDSDNYCKNCYPTCETCSSYGIDKCDKCINNFKIIENESNDKKTCLCDINTHYTYDTYLYKPIRQCNSCNSSCLGCISYSNCLDCKIGSKMEKGKVIHDNIFKKIYNCYIAIYKDINNETKNCYWRCNACDYSGEKNYCTSCIEGYHMANTYTIYNINFGKCIINCPSGKYNNYKDDELCLDCKDSCKECDGSGHNNCTECTLDKILRNGFCDPTCKIKKYLNLTVVPHICSDCYKSCSTCSGPYKDQCTSCNSYKYNLINGYCYRICNDNNFLEKCVVSKNCSSIEKEYNTCKKCSELCKTCIDNKDKCISCKSYFIYNKPLKKCDCKHDGFFLKNNKCNKCSVNCKNCYNFGINSCYECSDNKYIFYLNKSETSKKCISNCPNGYSHNIFRECKKCHPDCFTCEGLLRNQCIICPKQLKFYKKQCLIKCPGGYINKFFPGLNNICVKCKIGCKICDNNGICNECLDKYYKFKNNCLKTCPYRYYNDKKNNKCELCNNKCLICENINKCFKCKNKFILINNICHYNCPKGYYKLSNNCIKYHCVQGCKTCLDKKNCSECKLNYKLFKNKCYKCDFSYGLYNDCNEICGDGYKYNFNDHECDDGNKENGDGCNENCKIEKNYLCRRRNYRQPDKCFKETTIEFYRLEYDNYVIEFSNNFKNNIEDFKNLFLIDNRNVKIRYDILYDNNLYLNKKRLLIKIYMDTNYNNYITFKLFNLKIMDINRLEINFNDKFPLKYEKNNTFGNVYEDLRSIKTIADYFNTYLIYIIILSSFLSSKLPKFNLNILQRFLFIKLLKIDYPLLTKEYLSLISPNIDFEKIGLNFNNNSKKEKNKDKTFKYQPFTDLKFNKIFIFKGLVIFIIIFLQHYLILFLAKYFEIKEKKYYKYLVKNYNPKSKKYMIIFNLYLLITKLKEIIKSKKWDSIIRQKVINSFNFYNWFIINLIYKENNIINQISFYISIICFLIWIFYDIYLYILLKKNYRNNEVQKLYGLYFEGWSTIDLKNISYNFYLYNIKILLLCWIHILFINNLKLVISLNFIIIFIDLVIIYLISWKKKKNLNVIIQIIFIIIYIICILFYNDYKNIILEILIFISTVMLLILGLINS